MKIPLDGLDCELSLPSLLFPWVLFGPHDFSRSGKGAFGVFLALEVLEGFTAVCLSGGLFIYISYTFASVLHFI